MSLLKLDDFIKNFSINIVKLKEYELYSLNSQTHNNLFKQTILILFSRMNSFAINQSLWIELYYRSLALYKFKKVIGNSNIPIILVTKHNHIVPFYIKHQLHKSKSTIFRLDSHSDLNPIKNSSQLPILYKNYIDTKKTNTLNIIQDLVWDIGAAKSGVIFSTGIKDIIWGLPNWLPDEQVFIDYYIKKGSKNLNLCTNDDIKHISNLNEFTYIKGDSTNEKRIFSKIQTGKLSKTGFNNLFNIIVKNGNKYVLDIDLDYFICNGQPFDSSYWKESYDMQSFYRTEYKQLNQNLPRNINEKTMEIQKYQRKLLFEIKEINKRIKKFFKLLKLLKQKGLVPEYISISDSTNVNFYDCENCNSISNNYVPLNFALYVHTIVVDKLNKLF
jgi:hypothetical protein